MRSQALSHDSRRSGNAAFAFAEGPDENQAGKSAIF